MSGRGGKYVRKVPSLTKKQLFLLLLNVVLALLALACAWGLNAVKSALLTQSAAKAWRGSSEMRFAQVSVFLPEDEKTDVNSIESFRRTLDQALVDASLEAPEGGSLYTDAYSGTATVSVVSGKTSLSVKTIGVGGDFFLFHPLTLRSGSYLTGSDYMPDRVLLDEELAWALFGSYDVAGMSIQIGERTYPVAGVVHREDDFASKEAYQDGPGMFMSYEALNAISETKLSCYEIVMPDMISGYAESVVKDKFPVGDGTVVENTGRYSFGNLWSIFRSYGKRSMNTQGIIYPYWENAARLTEDYAALLLALLILFAICPVVFSVIWAVRTVKGLVTKAAGAAGRKIEEKIEEEKEKHYVGGGI
jgi:hypothetical protein